MLHDLKKENEPTSDRTLCKHLERRTIWNKVGQLAIQVTTQLSLPYEAPLVKKYYGYN